MYDAMNEPHEFVGDNREDANARACKYFGVSIDALEIHEFKPGEVYGLGGRCAVVAAPKGRPPVARGGGGDRGDRGDRPERGDRVGWSTRSLPIGFDANRSTSRRFSARATAASRNSFSAGSAPARGRSVAGSSRHATGRSWMPDRSPADAR